MLDRHILVFEAVGLGLSLLEDALEVGTDRKFAARDFGQGVQTLFSRSEQSSRLDAQLIQERADDRLIGIEKRDEQVHRLDPLVPSIASQFLSFLDRFLTPVSQFIKTKGHERMPPEDQEMSCVDENPAN
jgi:hypothetical protein